MIQYDVEMRLERVVRVHLVEKYPNLEGVNIAILNWRRMED